MIWHQHYQPVESAASLELAWDAFREAERIFGSARVLVREIHIRQSVPRTDLTQLARADIVNWTAFSLALKNDNHTPAVERVRQQLSSSVQKMIANASVSAPLTPEAELAVVNDLNRLLDSPQLYDDDAFSDVNLSDSLRKRLRSSSGNRKKIRSCNRELLAALFDGLLLSVPARREIREGIELCEAVPGCDGVFVLYITNAPDSVTFDLELCHEVLHLMNPDLYDWHVEGLANVFAELMAKKTGRSWQPMAERFRSRRDTDPYAVSYFMMRELYDALGEESLRTFLTYTKPASSGKLKIDLEAWMQTLSESQRISADKILSGYQACLLSATSHSGSDKTLSNNYQ